MIAALFAQSSTLGRADDARGDILPIGALTLVSNSQVDADSRRHAFVDSQLTFIHVDWF